jgi:hypothetical protein
MALEPLTQQGCQPAWEEAQPRCGVTLGRVKRRIEDTRAETEAGTRRLPDRPPHRSVRERLTPTVPRKPASRHDAGASRCDPARPWQRWGAIWGVGRTEVCRRGWHVSQPIARLRRRRRRQSRHACSATRRPSARRRQFPRIPEDLQCPRRFRPSRWDGAVQGAWRWVRHPRHQAVWVRRSRVLAVRRLLTPQPRCDGV